MKFTPIDKYMLLSREERRSHLDLSQECHLIGGYDSREYRGLLAHHLRTTIPTGNKRVVLCHACNTAGCSNPVHLYWGTRQDNRIDEIESGNYKSWYTLTVEKHGAEYVKEMLSKNGRKRRKNNIAIV